MTILLSIITQIMLIWGLLFNAFGYHPAGGLQPPIVKPPKPVPVTQIHRPRPVIQDYP